MSEHLIKERAGKALLAAGIGWAAWTAYHLVKERGHIELNIGLEQEEMLSESFVEKLSRTDDLATKALDWSTDMRSNARGEDMHKSLVTPIVFLFSKSQGWFVELQDRGNVRSTYIFPAVEEDGIIKTLPNTNPPEEGRGHQIYWGRTPEGVRQEARTFGPDGMVPEKALDRMHDLLSAPDLELMSLDQVMSRRGY